MDHKHAYRMLLTRREHRRYGVVASWNVEMGELEFYVSEVAGFGPPMCVHNYNVISKINVCIGRRILHAPLFAYFDDYF
jgi:hypothetical protein